MNVYWCDDHDGFWPVGRAALIVATDPEWAQCQLDAALKEKGLQTFVDHPYTLHKVDLDEMQAIIIHDGDY